MFTSTMSRLSYAKVLVEVNLLFDLPYSIEVTLPNDSLLYQQVVYETLPRFCKHNITLGHLTSTCTKSPPFNVPSKQPVHDSTPVPKSTRGRDSVFNRLGPQEGTPIVKCLEVLQIISHLIQLVCPQGEGPRSALVVHLAGARGCLPPPLLDVLLSSAAAMADEFFFC
ncbi:hypothetical protein Peur_037090 [Populus x canadensis]